MTEKHQCLTDEHTHILAGLSTDTKQKIIHHYVLKGFNRDELAKLYDVPIEVVRAILVRKQ